MNSYTTKNGTILPLINLKGKPYMQVAHRLVWFTEEASSYYINTELLVLTDEQTVARATIQVFDQDGRMIRQATASKRETKKDFSDHTEKAETGAIGRALVELGYGTQFAIADLDEGERLADSPIPIPKKASKTETSTVELNLIEPTEVSKPLFEEPKPKLSSFKKTVSNKASNGTTSGGWD